MGSEGGTEPSAAGFALATSEVATFDEDDEKEALPMNPYAPGIFSRIKPKSSEARTGSRWSLWFAMPTTRAP